MPAVSAEETIKSLYREKKWDELREIGAVDEITWYDCLARGTEPKYSKKTAVCPSIKTEVTKKYPDYHDSACLMDILDGATYKKFNFKIGHKEQYWKGSEMVNV